MDQPHSPTVLVRYWAGAKAAAGTAQESLPGATLEQVLGAAVRAHGAPLERVLAACSFLVDSVSTGDRPPAEVVLASGAEVDVLPPFAGG